MDTPLTPSYDDLPDTPIPDERRRELRIPFLSECQVLIRSPHWAVLPGPLVGETRNITLHGLRISMDGFARAGFTKWAEHLHEGDTLGVVVRIVHNDTQLELPGEITWSLFREQDEDSPEGTCEAGVLLSLLEPETEAALRALIQELSE